MAVSKVILDGVTQIDVTTDTVVADKLGSGYTATKNDGTKITGTATIRGDSLDELSWDDIKDISDAGLASTYFNIGDSKKIVLGANTYYTTSPSVQMHMFFNYNTVIFGEVYYATIIGINHNSSIEGTGITFQIGKLTNTPPYNYDSCISEYNKKSNSVVAALNSYGTYLNNMTMGYNGNTSDSSGMGWSTSTMRTQILGQNPSSPPAGSLMEALPDDLRTVMKSVTKWTDNVGGTSLTSAANVTATTDYLFLPAAYEVFGTTTGFSNAHANAAEADKQAIYEYYTTNSTAKWYFGGSAILNGNSYGGYLQIPTFLRSPVNLISSGYGQYYAATGTNMGGPDTKTYLFGWKYSNSDIYAGISPCFVV